MKKTLLIVILLGMFKSCWGFTVNTENISVKSWTSGVVTVSSNTATLTLAEDNESYNQFFYNGSGVVFYIGDYTVTNSTFTAAGGYPVANGVTFSPDEPCLWQGNLYGILAAGSTGTAQIKIFKLKK